MLEDSTITAVPVVPGAVLEQLLRDALAWQLLRALEAPTDPAALATAAELLPPLFAPDGPVVVADLHLVAQENAWRLPREARDRAHARRPAATFVDGIRLLPGSVLAGAITTSPATTGEQAALLLVALDVAMPRLPGGLGRELALGSAGAGTAVLDMDAAADPRVLAAAREWWTSQLGDCSAN